MKTNRRWLESLTDKQLSEFLTRGITVRTDYSDCIPFSISVRQIAGAYIQSTLGIEKWLSAPQEYEVVEEIEGYIEYKSVNEISPQGVKDND